MAFCRNCGTDAKDNARTCPYCGRTMPGVSSENQNSNSTGTRRFGGINFSRDNNGRPSGINGNNGRRPNDTRYDGYRYYREDGFDVKDVGENRYLSVLCYFNILFLIPLFLKPGSAYIRYHSNQGLLLTIFTLLVIVAARIPIIGWIIGAIGFLFTLFCLIRGVLNAISGTTHNLPIIGVFSIIK